MSKTHTFIAVGLRERLILHRTLNCLIVAMSSLVSPIASLLSAHAHSISFIIVPSKIIYVHSHAMRDRRRKRAGG